MKKGEYVQRVTPKIRDNVYRKISVAKTTLEETRAYHNQAAASIPAAKKLVESEIHDSPAKKEDNGEESGENEQKFTTFGRGSTFKYLEEIYSVLMVIDDTKLQTPVVIGLKQHYVNNMTAKITEDELELVLPPLVTAADLFGGRQKILPALTIVNCRSVGFLGTLNNDPFTKLSLEERKKYARVLKTICSMVLDSKTYHVELHKGVLEAKDRILQSVEKLPPVPPEVTESDSTVLQGWNGARAPRVKTAKEAVPAKEAYAAKEAAALAAKEAALTAKAASSTLQMKKEMLAASKEKEKEYNTTVARLKAEFEKERKTREKDLEKAKAALKEKTEKSQADIVKLTMLRDTLLNANKTKDEELRGLATEIKAKEAAVARAENQSRGHAPSPIYLGRAQQVPR